MYKTMFLYKLFIYCGGNNIHFLFVNNYENGVGTRFKRYRDEHEKYQRT